MKRENELAKIINNATMWYETENELAELCELAGLSKEWEAKTPDNFESIIKKSCNYS